MLGDSWIESLAGVRSLFRSPAQFGWHGAIETCVGGIAIAHIFMHLLTSP
jgi:hypothetical protein